MIGGGYLAAGGLALSIACGIGGYFHGVDTGRQREHEETREAVDRAMSERDRLRGEIEQGALEQLKADQQRQAVHREIIREQNRIVERPVYRTQCVDADGVRILDRAADAANGADRAGPPDDAAAAATEGAAGAGRDDGRPVSGESD